MQEVVDFADEKNKNGKRRRSWKTVHHMYKSLPDQTYVRRFRKYLQRHGTKRQKTNNIDEVVFKTILEAREQALPLHDNDLQRWALKAAKEVHLEDFHASHGWMNNFKARHHVVSRRITNVVTRHEIENPDAILKAETDFRESFFKISSHYSPSQTFNTDQVGVEKELYSKRTLTMEGEKKVFGTVRSKNATTHSYTLQPTISLEGKLVGPMYLCLQEPKGRWATWSKKAFLNQRMWLSPAPAAAN
ncbi:unnamed protein product [Didymodactylos carnosus]|uniref:HTH CENPB-type domain-containing protein n=1 Tax=Didymodactylos carnosus TaxID=1234261 RepID=A0A815DP07_9BILA|nr:unnamed protein product [Didymodactylos carnosus]CAF1300794.1 unnamed protein product [Didymodactylos carnosus]CAF3902720.1 unnamed protein product [Didymodactylos carnosus]CAF4124457.1 unnamed protein product [Didymodactylos carnosus]